MKIPPEAISYGYFRASGPGGQNVNKVSTAVRLRFELDSARLPPAVETRLIRLAGKKMTRDGALIIEASRFRTRERNQADALSRLNALLSLAEKMPKKRRASLPTRASIRKRIESKKRRGNIKKLRGKVRRGD